MNSIIIEEKKKRLQKKKYNRYDPNDFNYIMDKMTKEVVVYNNHDESFDDVPPPLEKEKEEIAKEEKLKQNHKNEPARSENHSGGEINNTFIKIFFLALTLFLCFVFLKNDLPFSFS